jgi:hypothetical protein
MPEPTRPAPPEAAPGSPAAENADEHTAEQADNQLLREQVTGQPPPKSPPRREELLPQNGTGELPEEKKRLE